MTGRFEAFQVSTHPPGWAEASEVIVKFVHPVKALASIQYTVPFNDTDSILEQFEKAP